MSTTHTPEEQAILDFGAAVRAANEYLVVIRTLDDHESFCRRYDIERMANPATRNEPRVLIRSYTLPGEDLTRGLRFYRETEERALGCRVWKEIHPSEYRP